MSLSVALRAHAEATARAERESALDFSTQPLDASTPANPPALPPQGLGPFARAPEWRLARVSCAEHSSGGGRVELDAPTAAGGSLTVFNHGRTMLLCPGASGLDSNGSSAGIGTGAAHASSSLPASSGAAGPASRLHVAVADSFWLIDCSQPATAAAAAADSDLVVRCKPFGPSRLADPSLCSAAGRIGSVAARVSQHAVYLRDGWGDGRLHASGLLVDLGLQSALVEAIPPTTASSSSSSATAAVRPRPRRDGVLVRLSSRRLLLAGGWDGAMALDDAWLLRIGRNRCSNSNSNGGSAGSPSASQSWQWSLLCRSPLLARRGMHAHRLDSSRVLLYGGLMGLASYRADTLLLDVAARSVQPFPFPSPAPSPALGPARAWAMSALIRRRWLLLHGGCGSHGPSAESFVLDLHDGQWRTLPSAASSPASHPLPRISAPHARVRNELWTYGGFVEQRGSVQPSNALWILTWQLATEHAGDDEGESDESSDEEEDEDEQTDAVGALAIPHSTSSESSRSRSHASASASSFSPASGSGPSSGPGSGSASASSASSASSGASSALSAPRSAS